MRASPLGLNTTTANYGIEIWGGDIFLPVTLSHPPGEQATFQVKAGNGTSAIEDTDYAIRTKSVTFGPDTPKTLYLPVSVLPDSPYGNATRTLLLEVADIGAASNTAGYYTPYNIANITITAEPQLVASPQFFAAPQQSYNRHEFVTTWTTTTANDTIHINVGGSSSRYTIDWGDGAAPVSTTGNTQHVYTNPGTYTVKIINIDRFIAGDKTNAGKLASIEQWGTAEWSSMAGALKDARNVRINAADAPDLSGVTDMSEMFWFTTFSGDLSSWDVSNVTDMSEMFRISSFNGTISSWDVSSVTDMSGMFVGAQRFNQPLDSWDVSSVTDMSRMFAEARPFKQPLDSWDVSSVTNMSRMFASTAFNGDISSWNVSQVTDMTRMFAGASAFNQPLNDWDVSSVTDMADMFKSATAFSQNLGNWYITLDSTDISIADAPGVVANMAAQNRFLSNMMPTYGIGSSDDQTSFVISDKKLNMTVTPDKPSYVVNITSSTSGEFGTNNHRVYDIAAAGFNNPPTANAGDPQNVAEGATVSLNGTASDDDPEDTLAYKWTHNATFTISLRDSTALNTSFVAPNVDADTPVLFTLNVTDGTAYATATVTIVIEYTPNRAPTADAGGNQVVVPGVKVTLDGTGSSDPDVGDSLTYLWVQTGGPTVTLAGSDTGTPTFTVPDVDKNTDMIFDLTVTDTGTLTATDTVTITVRHLSPDDFVTTWTTTAANETITIYVGGSSAKYTIDWGDGMISSNVAGNQDHRYANPGTHTVRISGDFDRFIAGQDDDRDNAAKLGSIEQWGAIEWSSMAGAFKDAGNMIHNADDAPDPVRRH